MQAQIRLTATAQDHARKHALASRLDQLRLGAEVQADDLVALPEAGREGIFIVRSRRWQIDPDGGAQLVIELDHPPRAGGRS